MRRTQRRNLLARLGDPARMLAVFDRELPQLADGAVRVTACCARPSKSRKALRAGRLEVAYVVQADVAGTSREYVVLGLAPVEPAFLEELRERCHALRDHPWVAPFHELATYVAELELALLLFPLDPALPGLAEVTGSEGAPAIAACLPECRSGARVERVEGELVRYKPLDRAVLKVRVSLRDPRGVAGERTVYAKFFASDLGAECFRCLAALRPAARKAQCLRVPEPLGYDETRRMLVLGEAAGRQDLTGWIRRLEGGETLPPGVDLERLERCAVVLARALRELQRSDIRPRTRRSFRYELRRVKKDRDLLLDDLRASEPELAARIDGLIGRLSALAPAREQLLPAHGGFHHHQVLGDGPVLTLVDWDGISLASPAFDASTFLGRLLREPRKRPGCAPELEQMAAAFREEFVRDEPELARALDLYEGLAVTGHVLRALRRPEGKETVQELQELVAAAMASLERVGAAGAPGR